MKRNVLSLLLTILTFASLICTFSITASAEDTATPSVTIGKFNLVFEDNVYLKYAVKFEGIEDDKINSDNIGMLYFTAPQSDYTNGGEAYSSSVVGYTTIDGEKYYTFEYRHITAKQMTDYIYSVAYIDLDGTRYYSAPVKYSVLDYCYSKLGKTGEASTNESFKKLLTTTLEQGAAAQEYFNYRTDKLANAEYYLIEVVGGTLEDGFTKGLYLSTDTVTITAPETSGELVFAEWQNSNGETISSSPNANITNISKNETYTATCKEVLKYSEGLLFGTNNDGTCYVSGIGTCTDTNIVIPPTTPLGKRVTRITDKAFYNCSNITNVVIPDTITSIGREAFYNCSNLTSLSIPSSITSIEYLAFDYCNNLESVYIDDLTAWCNIAFNNYRANPLKYADNLYLNKELVTELVIPDNVTSIGQSAFSGCSSITSVVIPNSITSIGAYAFDYCENINAVYIYDLESWCNISFNNLQSTPLRGNGNLYLNGDLVTDIVIPSGISNIKDCAFAMCKSIKSVTVPSSVTTIGKNAFYECSNITTVNISDSVIDIGMGAFYSCSKITEITLPKNVEAINGYAFQNCNNLKNIVIPDKVKSIGNAAFAFCTNLQSIIIPDNVSSIGISAFMDCTSLTDVYYASTTSRWTEIAIESNNDSLTNATRYYYSETNPKTEGNFWHYDENGEIAIWPAYVAPNYSVGLEYTSNGDGTCYVSGIGTCTDTDIVIPSEYNGMTVTGIGYYAFSPSYHTANFTSITIPSSIVSIDEGAFRYQHNLLYAVFEEPDGWSHIQKVDGDYYTCYYFDPNALSDPSQAALILSSEEHAFCIWSRN